jgi:hypothetical protein
MQRLRRRSGVLTTVGQRACAASGLAFTNGRVSTVVTQTDLADAVMRVAAASARIAEAVGFELAKPERARATACTPRLPQQAPLSSCGDTHGRRYNQHVSTAPSEVRPMTVDELKAAALQLAPQARADLARELLSSLDELSEAEIEQLWFAEAARRDRELDAGTVQSLPADEVLARAKARRG